MEPERNVSAARPLLPNIAKMQHWAGRRSDSQDGVVRRVRTAPCVWLFRLARRLQQGRRGVFVFAFFLSFFPSFFLLAFSRRRSSRRPVNRLVHGKLRGNCGYQRTDRGNSRRWLGLGWYQMPCGCRFLPEDARLLARVSAAAVSSF